MDNRSVNVVSEGNEALRMAISLMWTGTPGGKASHYKIVKLDEQTNYYGAPEVAGHRTEFVEDEQGTPTLILLWSDERGAEKLPYPLDLDEAVTFASGWLKKADYGQEPGHDGDNGKGFRVFSDFWGHVAGHRYGIVGLQPAWAMYGK